MPRFRNQNKPSLTEDKTPVRRCEVLSKSMAERESTAAEVVESEDEVSGLDFEETELKLGLPGGGGQRGLGDGDRKRGFSDSVGVTFGVDVGSVVSSESKVSGSAEKPPAKAQVVGWPPVRSFRKNVLKSCTYVKVAVDGAPYLRKVDLEIYGGYEQLLTALEGMFFCFKICYYLNDRKLVDPVTGTEYVPTYEDKEGDWMLVGDVPWKMFIESCKRLRLMKKSEAVNLASPTVGQIPTK